MSESKSSKMAALIPSYLGLTAITTKDIVFFGKATIHEMILSWRSHASSLSSRIKRVDERLKLMVGKTAKDIIEIAKQAENPEFPQIGVREDGSGDNLEPLDVASINREHGATTFNVCGWCNHAGGGSYRYHYNISTSCNIINNAGGMKDEDRKFNTPCVFKTADDSFFGQIRNGLKSTRQRLIKEKRQTDKKIGLLLTLEKRAEKKPAMSGDRPYNWFNENDPVMCFIGKQKGIIVPDQFVTAKVIDGWRHHDGRVSVRYDKRVHRGGDYLKGHGGGYGTSRPEIMHVWEFEYLLAHPDFASLWSSKGKAKHLEGFDAEKFLGAIQWARDECKPHLLEQFPYPEM